MNRPRNPRPPLRLALPALLACLAGLTCLSGADRRAEAAARPAEAPPAAADTGSALARTDPGYDEAMALAEHLQNAGIRIAAVRRSTFAGLLGATPCAAFASERGAFCAFFLEEPDGAERVTWEVKPHGGRYRYTFHWTEGGRARSNRVEFDRTQRFVRSGPWFVIAFSEATRSALREALALPRRGVG